MPRLAAICAALALTASIFAAAPSAGAAAPITIGFSMEATGPLAVVGKTGLLAMRIWQDDINAKGGLLGRPVRLVYYDDQGNPSLVPGIYTKLIDIDKVDLLISSYGTNLTAPAMPIVMQHNRLFFGLFALAVNAKFHYPKYFSMLTLGPDPIRALSQGYFELAAAQTPKPKTVAIVAADAEFAKKAADGARANASEAGLEIVYDRSYPPSTVDYTPIVRGVGAANPDIVFVASYPPDTVGIVHAVNEVGLTTRMLGGGMVGLQTTSLKTQLGPQINGIVNGELWEPLPSLRFPGVMAFIEKYQAKAPAEKIDPLGYFLPPFAYAELEVLGDAVAATKSLDEDTLAKYMHGHPFRTIVGDIAFGPDGEWTESKVLWVQYHGIFGHDLEQFRKPSVVSILLPEKYRTGSLVYPYDEARK